MTAFPSLPPIESSTLGAESALFAANLAERLSLALRTIAEGMHVGSVGLAEAVQELRGILDEAQDLGINLESLFHDGCQQLTEAAS